MRIYLVGADFEENLGLCTIAAAAEAGRHQVTVLPFNDGVELDALKERILADQPEVVGLSIQFQHRAWEFLALAGRLRRSGYRGHITCGGQFPSAAWRDVLEGGWGVDSIVLYDGEQTFRELLDALASGRPLSEVAGLALPGPHGGKAVRTRERPLANDLDRFPFPRRYRSHTRHLGIPFIPVMGSRGCWGKCSYCAITSGYDDARDRAGGKRLRHRSPENIAEELALLANAVGGSAVFCFHDDNFLLPRPEASLQRVRAIRETLDRLGVGPVGLIGKCRPDSLTPELARQLRALGVIRLYVGVENVSQAGSDHLGRRVQVEQVHQALQACFEAGIFSCYNLLVFEPEATIDDVRENVACIRRHPSHPVNFCRAEPYCGTPLQRHLADEGKLGGSYLGYDYRIEDDRTELLFRICAAAFRERNFAPSGVHNRYMGLGYMVSLLERFYDDPVGVTAIGREADALTRTITAETAGFLDEALGIVEGAFGDDERIQRETADLALRIADADRRQQARIDEVYALINGFAENAPRVALPRVSKPSSHAVALARRVAHLGAGLWLAGCAIGTAGCEKRQAVPTDGGKDMRRRDAGADVTVVDCVPYDSGRGDMKRKDLRRDILDVDPVPPDMGRRDSKRDSLIVDPPPPPDGMIVDPAPKDGTVVDMLPHDAGARLTRPPCMGSQYRDTSPARAVRSCDLPFSDPPVISLRAVRGPSGICVRLIDAPAAVSLRWQCEGSVEGEGCEVLWSPASSEDQLSVGVRSRAGIAVVSVRAKDVA